MKYPLPVDTRSILDKNLLKTTNFSLLFNKYVNSWQDNWQMKEEDSKKFRQALTNFKFNKEFIVNVINRQHAMIRGLKDSSWYVESLTAVTDSRLIIGLGGASVIETGMTLHPLYGFPYLPGSGLKGLARAYAEIGVHAQEEELFEVFGSEDKDPRHATNNRQGKVFFMDGLPTSFPKLELDIMNPHYGDYYQGKKLPADYMNPVPVTFLAVASGEEFSFTIISKEKELAEKGRQWLGDGLTELGAGGKTNIGYGYFRPTLSSSTMAVDTVGKKSPGIPSQLALMETLMKRIEQCRGPGDKSLLESAFKDAEVMSRSEREEFIKNVKEKLPKIMKDNPKIKAFLKEKEKEILLSG